MAEVPEVPSYRDPEHGANSDIHWTGDECETEGCTNMAGTHWGHKLCWECNAKRMDEFRGVLRDAAAGKFEKEIEPEKNMSDEKSDGERHTEPVQNHYSRLIDRLDPMMDSDQDKYTRITGPDGKPNPTITILTKTGYEGAAQICSPDIEFDWYPLSQLVTNFNGELFLVNWLYDKKRTF